MGEPRGPDGSTTIDSAQRLVYWAIGILLALLSIGRLPGVSRAARAEDAAPPKQAVPTESTEAAAAARAPPSGARFSTSCLSRAAHPECCEGWRMLDEYRRLYEPSVG